MHQIPVNQIMKNPVITIGPDAHAVDAANLMEEKGIRRLPVVDEMGCLVGIVTDADVLEAETAEHVLSSYEPGADEEWLAVGDIMTAEVITIGPKSILGELAETFMKHKVGGVPVVVPLDPAQSGPGCPLKLLGIVTETDIFRIIVDAWKTEG